MRVFSSLFTAKYSPIPHFPNPHFPNPPLPHFPTSPLPHFPIPFKQDLVLACISISDSIVKFG
ncbi:MAG: hypothetical protein EWV83_14710 [Microcystis sp. M_OC_Ca_00000000_S217Cul]|nr:MAG: hypothetical protein EWV83_14710 [Microcystis sp. M_OC_Ca_00000000_S217Cul]TRT89679.1 MAG: hypothetical protein EWV66_09675 [Microcystis sp. M_OC_Ca_00000000_C217Col]